VVGVGGAGEVVGEVDGAWPPTPATMVHMKPTKKTKRWSMFCCCVVNRRKWWQFETRVKQGRGYIGRVLGKFGSKRNQTHTSQHE